MLPETGSISISQVNVELKKGETTVITLNDTDVRKLAGKPSGVISMNDLRGKSNTEYVENYQLLNGSYEGKDEIRNINMNIPKKIISGTFIISLSAYKASSHGSNRPDGGQVIINSIGYSSIRLNIIVNGYFNPDSVTDNKAVNNIPSGNMPVQINTGGSGYSSGGNWIKVPAGVRVNIKFTGEWEA